ncbi:MAG: ABC transporter permease [Solirubrobacteraceae bacterium]|nr:ABC transporter permease [Solirubrobacteraceae bacterium]
MSADRTPSRMGALSAAWTLALKDLKVAFSYRLSFFFGHLGVAFTLILFYFVSRVVGDSDVVGSPDEYFQFVVVGMAMAGIVETAVGASMGAARRDQVEGTLEAVASLPIGSATLGLGWLLYPILDGLIGAVFTILLAIPLGMVGADPYLPSIVLSIILSILVFASFGFFGAAIVLAFQQGAGVVPVFLALLALISGTLFPVEVLPPFLETLSQFSPLTHALDSMRAALLDAATISEIGDSLLILAGFAVVLLPLSVFALELGLRRARRTGGLSRF